LPRVEVGPRTFGSDPSSTCSPAGIIALAGAHTRYARYPLMTNQSSHMCHGTLSGPRARERPPFSERGSIIAAPHQIFHAFSRVGAVGKPRRPPPLSRVPGFCLYKISRNFKNGSKHGPLLHCRADPRHPLLRSERMQGFTAGPVYGRAKCLPMLGSLKT